MPEIIVKLGERIIHRYFFDKDTLSVGRARDNDIVIENLSVSRNHCRIKRQDGKFFLTDMNSANGSLVNGVRITKTEVVHNDQITIGKHTLIFLAQEEAGSGPVPVSAPPSAQPMAAGPSETASPIPGEVGQFTVTKGKQAGQEFYAANAETSIGRAGENDIRLHDWFVSKKHALVRRDGSRFVLKDLESWRGTTVNGNSVREAELRDGDEIIFGTTVLNFRKVDVATWQDAMARAAAAPPAPIEDEMEGEAPDAMGTPAIAAPTIRQSKGDGITLEAFDPEPVVQEDLTAPTQASHKRVAAADAGDTDEFAPFTEDELEALEGEADLHEGSPAEEADNRRASWELLEAEKMFDLGEEEGFSLVDSHQELTAQEQRGIDSKAAISGLEARAAEKTVSAAEAEKEADEEEAALNKASETAVPDITPPPPARKPTGSAPPPPSPRASLPPGEGAAQDREVQMWEKALQNKSSVIRKNAAKELKKLTGKDYDWQSEPSRP